MDAANSNWMELFIAVALDSPALILYFLLLGLGVLRATRGEGGIFIVIAALSWIGLSLVSKLYYTLVWPTVIDSIVSGELEIFDGDVESFVRLSSFAINLAYCFPLLCLLIGLLPRRTTPPQDNRTKPQDGIAG